MSGSPHRRGSALVLGRGTALLGVVRSLGRAGVEVHVAWHDEGDPALRSRYIAETHPLARPHGYGEEWRGELLALMRTRRFDLVIPCEDETMLPLAAHRAELERAGRVYLPGERALEVLQDKHRTTALARTLGIPVPREVILPDTAGADALRETFALPVILKPERSYGLADLENKRLVARADTWHEADLLLEEMLPDGPVAVQEHCPGVGIGVELLMADGRPLLSFQHERLHEPIYGGGSTYRRSAPVDSELEGWATALLGELAYTGVAMVEFKRDERTGRTVLLEVNARFWGSLPLAVAAGADFPRALWELLVEGRREFDAGYRPGLAVRHLSADVRWHVHNHRAERRDPTLNSRPWPAVARQTALSLLTGRERSDFLTLDDPAPGLAELAELGREVRRGARLRAQVAHARLSAGRRRRMRARAGEALHRSPRLLFVCAGNIGRSPFAAAMAERTLGNGRVVRSAGFGRAGRRATPDAVEAAAGFGVDLAEHRSHTISAALVRESEAIFVFDYANLSHLARRFPGAEGKVHLLGALDPSGPLFISDPWGADAEVYAATYRRIAAALTAG